ncbi:MAG TPA: carboxypeptidase M32 [Ktedonosporobacter sp.]|nr:carboxypeptidase M32 [Ktedonosporobacter sp.]
MLVTEQKPINFTQSDQRISDLLDALHEVTDLEAMRALLDWDQQTGMPHGAGEVRSHQAATLQGLIHERWTSPRLGDLLTTLEEVIDQPSFSNADRGLVRQARRTYDQSTKLPRQLVEEMTRAGVISHEAWVRARANNDFASFAPHLERTVAFQREVADRFGYQEYRYDALLDIYEPALTTREVERLFAPVRDASSSLLQRIQASGTKIDASFLQGHFPHEQQKALAEKLLKNIGYDFSRGQIAISAHPFTNSFGSPQDVRLTVRYSNFLASSVMAALHEGGHALYEQGIASSLLRTPLAGGTSLGIHESQSRLWENAIGRSEPFWRGQYHLVQEAFPQHFQHVNVQGFAQALNAVEAGLIRVEADEVTYNLHIIIRFELEKALINGEISVESLPRLWNEKYRSYLGVEPDSDSNGVLQDVHWTSGFGYFPTYTLGNLYGAQIYHTLRQQLPDLDQRLAGGETAFILDWLTSHIYTFGSIYQPAELMVHATNEEANPDYLVRYLTDKFTKLYDL